MSDPITPEEIKAMRGKMWYAQTEHQAELVWPQSTVVRLCGSLELAWAELGRAQTTLRDELARRTPQGVEVPELTKSCATCAQSSHCVEAKYGDACDDYMETRRLVPTPPQAAPDLTDAELDAIYPEAHGLGTHHHEIHRRRLRKVIAAATCKDPLQVPHPLQPEERRVGPDEVVVPRSAAEFAIWAFDCIECPDTEHYEALRAFYDALRTSAQDQAS